MVQLDQIQSARKFVPILPSQFTANRLINAVINSRYILFTHALIPSPYRYGAGMKQKKKKRKLEILE